MQFALHWFIVVLGAVLFLCGVALPLWALIIVVLTRLEAHRVHAARGTSAADTRLGPAHQRP
ncbi:MAG TPA: hypothetical protein VLV50_01560 [Stellaceae bacterium]|nr:hypothetical protein [Stellaceae bacterium]